MLRSTPVRLTDVSRIGDIPIDITFTFTYTGGKPTVFCDNVLRLVA